MTGVVASVPLIAGVEGIVGNLVVAVLVLALIYVLAKFVLNIAFRVVKIAAVVIAVLWLLSVVTDFNFLGLIGL
jgi:signal transduction histidine kinase